MKASEARLGRIFVIRMEDGEVLHEVLERFAVEREIQAAAVMVLGGADQGSRLVVGPTQGRASPVIPLEHTLPDVHEVVGNGTLFPDDQGRPVLHLHLACGREESTTTGCVRLGVKTWHILEIVLFELLGSSASRRLDPLTGFKLLVP